MQHARQELCHTTTSFSSTLLLIAEVCSFLHCGQLPWLTACCLRHCVNICVIALLSVGWVVQGLQQHKHRFSSDLGNSTLSACQVAFLLCRVARTEATGKLVMRDSANVSSKANGLPAVHDTGVGVTLDVSVKV